MKDKKPDTPLADMVEEMESRIGAVMDASVTKFIKLAYKNPQEKEVREAYYQQLREIEKAGASILKQVTIMDMELIKLLKPPN